MGGFPISGARMPGRMRWSRPIALAAVTALVGCGGGDTKTVTETRTVTVTTPAPSAATPRQTGGTPAPDSTDPAARRRRAFCESTRGDTVQQAGSEATRAFNDRDLGAMLAAQEKAFDAAERAPAGASCAVVALNTLRFHWNNGAAAFKDHDYRAEAEKVRSFQSEHELVGALPG